MELKGLALHEHPQYREACANVLNEEWSRSSTARLHMLDKSRNELPYNIVYLEAETEGGAWNVIGHSRLCKVHGQTKSCFVESVVISISKRGRGYGRKLMEETEIHAAKLGFEVVYLTTHDKQDFYHHIGYDYCDPIVSLGSASSLVSEAIANRLLGNSVKDASHPSLLKKQTPKSANKTCEPDIAKCSRKDNSCCKEQIPAPPALQKPLVHLPSPPPAQPAPQEALVAPPGPPPAPPPPLLPPHSSESGLLSKIQESKPVRMDPSKVYWLKKTFKNMHL